MNLITSTSWTLLCLRTGHYERADRTSECLPNTPRKHQSASRISGILSVRSSTFYGAEQGRINVTTMIRGIEGVQNAKEGVMVLYESHDNV